MPDYQKKKVKNRARKTTARQREPDLQDIPMKETKRKPAPPPGPKKKTPQKVRDNSLRVVNGRKKERRRNALVGACILVCFVCAYLVVLCLHPVGAVEYFTNLYASLGSGKGYDVTLTGGEVLNCIAKDSRYFILSETSVTCVNNSGKTVLTMQHGFAQPVLKVGDTRFLVYGQGEKNLRVYDLNKELYAQNYDNAILCADIGKNGSVAVATKTEGYESKVTVTDKNNKKLYEWFSSEETVNAVCLSDSGKILAVATLNVTGGSFVSKIYLLKFDSANPVYTFEYSGETVYNLYRCSGNYMYAVLGNRIEFFNINNGEKKEYSSDYTVNIVRKCGNTVLTASTLAANKGETTVNMYSEKGEELSSFKISGSVSDLLYKNGLFYLLSDSGILLTDKSGTVQSRTDCSFEIKYIAAISKRAVAGISSTLIQKYIFENTEE